MVLEDYSRRDEVVGLLTGNVLDMWNVYKMVAPDPEFGWELTIYDIISERKHLLFPDFFKSVHAFLKGRASHQLEAELEETFSFMHDNWGRYEPFFNNHPELRYLQRHDMFSFALSEMAGRLPGLRSLNAPGFWSLEEYHRLRGNLNTYMSIDEELRKQTLIGTVFEKEGGHMPGAVMFYALPYAPYAREIAPYLGMLKHGDIIGFGSIELAETQDGTFIAVTSLQTDLLRKDAVKGMRDDLPLPTTFFPAVARNEDRRYIVPAGIRRPFLGDYAWAQRLLEAVETTALSMPDQVKGVIVPTASFTILDPRFVKLDQTDETLVLQTQEKPFSKLSGYSADVYNDMPGKRGYNKEDAEVSFPLTNNVGKGTFWVADVDSLRRKVPIRSSRR